ncbi:MAG: succinylglutamate desuccinylase/aspartoacylase family protein [Deltaproteobacteria bacterium]|nr:succinylglutamate desuccinylase/aspartoacylase family protein [Deltaproteobacteria bacterium]
MRSRRSGLLAALLLVLAAAPPRAAATPVPWGPLTMLSREVAPGQREKLTYGLLTSFVENEFDTTVVALRGRNAGPTLCVVAGVRGDELNGVEIARRLTIEVDPQQLAGTLLVVPIANLAAFRNGARQLPDGSDLDRAFPGSPTGGTAARIAQALFDPVIRQCQAVIDLHSAAPGRRVPPQLRTDLANPDAVGLARVFGGVVLGGRGAAGSLRRAALDAGIPALSYVAGAPGRFDAAEIAQGVDGLRRALADLGMIAPQPAVAAATVFHATQWVRVPEGSGGIFLTARQPGEEVRQGEMLGSVTDPLTERRIDIVAPRSGRLVAVAEPRVLLPGAPLFQLAFEPPPA